MDSGSETSATSEARSPLVWASLVAIAAAALYGAHRLWFLCDDAYIYFRYVANAREGLGLVWNAPPFLPVEGYTGFLWALLLWAAWSWFGVEPPDSANLISIACGLAQLALVAAVLLRWRGRDGRGLSGGVVLLGVLVVAGNRTFLQWFTSGLETALFNLAFLAWVLLGFRTRSRRTPGWLLAWTAVATVAALTRPDGMLLVAASVAAGIWARPGRRWWIGLAPALAVVAHALWRRWFYGEWLPNTYYAKVVSAWPEAGMRYAAGFAVEHGTWLWLVVAGIAGLAWLGRRPRHVWRSMVDGLPVLAVVTTTVVHVGYYVLIVRWRSLRVPRTEPSGAAVRGVGAAAAGVRVPQRSRARLRFGFAGRGWLGGLAAPGFDRRPAARGAVLSADRRPGCRHGHSRSVAGTTATRGGCSFHYVCCRCPQHAITLDKIRLLLPPARTLIDASADDVPVIKTPAAGIPGWTLPNCAVLDLLGLNDWVTARVPSGGPPLPHVGRGALRAGGRSCGRRCGRPPRR